MIVDNVVKSELNDNVVKLDEFGVFISSNKANSHVLLPKNKTSNPINFSNKPVKSLNRKINKKY